MSKKTILADRDNYRTVIEEQKYSFVVWVIESIAGIDENELIECFPEEGYGAVQVQHRINLKKLCNKHVIDIVDNHDGELVIYINNEVKIAEWKKPWTNLRRANHVNPLKQLYMEINIDYWTIFETETNDQ